LGTKYSAIFRTSRRGKLQYGGINSLGREGRSSTLGLALGTRGGINMVPRREAINQRPLFDGPGFMNPNPGQSRLMGGLKGKGKFTEGGEKIVQKRST